MISLYYSKQAENDLIEIVLYMGEKNVAAAERLLNRIYNACEMLKDFPLMGQSRHDIRPGMGHRIVDNYTILYRIENDIIDISRIIHSARHLPDIL